MPTPSERLPDAVVAPAQIRTSHLRHEASVQSVGILYYVAAGFALLALFAPLLADRPWVTADALAGGVFLLLAAVYFQLGRWFQALDPKGRLPGTILAAIGLLAIPIGTAVSAYILYLIHSKKGKMVFSPEYRAVIAATPQIRYKTPLLVWIFIGLLVAVFVAMFVSVAVRR